VETKISALPKEEIPTTLTKISKTFHVPNKRKDDGRKNSSNSTSLQTDVDIGEFDFKDDDLNRILGTLKPLTKTLKMVKTLNHTLMTLH
jgi:hypothetical protein